MSKVCANCKCAFEDKYPININMQAFSTDVCVICNKDLSLTFLLNGIINTPTVSDYVYSVLTNRIYGEGTVEVPKLNEM